MTIIEQIKAEIERLKGQLIRGACAAQIEMETNCKEEAYDEILSFLSTLESENPMNQEGLEEEIDRLWGSFADEMEGPHNLFDIYARLARHFAQWQKEQMMKGAVQGVVCYGSKGAYIETDFLGEYNTDVYGNPGDKVRIIIVKED